MLASRTAIARILTVGVLMALAGAAAAQHAYPSRPIRFIVPYPPGGSSNAVARLVGQKVTESWGQQVIVDNRPGGNSIIGTEALAKSPPDGYTIMLTSNSHVINPSLLAKLPYDAIKDFASVATLVRVELMLVVNASVPASTLQEFIALARSRPGQLNYGSASAGGLTHLVGEIFDITAGVRMQHVPYKGGGPMIADLLGGQIQLTFTPPINVAPHIKSGKLKAIAISGEKRYAGLPQVPTFREAGLPGYSATNWYAVLAPAGTPKPVIDTLSAEIGKILAMPDVKDKLVSQALEPFISTPEQLAALMKADLAKFAKTIKAANIKLEN